MGTKMKTVISASRRTDLPAFYYDWLQTVLKKGRVELVNPRFLKQTYEVDLHPESVHSVVLWSKDFRNVLKKPMYLENYHLYFQYTINNYSPVFEPRVPAYSETIRTLAELLKKYRPEQFNIRFDPVIISNLGEKYPTWEKPGQARLQCFTNLCRDLRALGMQGCRVTTSYIALYSHVKKRLAEAKIPFRHLDDHLLSPFFTRMAEIAHRYSFRLYCCSSPSLEEVHGLERGRCIDGQLLERLFGELVSKAKDNGQRVACGCTKSKDIGRYDQVCGFSCLYCYRIQSFRSK
jgi:hypothetical protein